MHPGAGAQDKAFALLCVQGNTRGSGDKSLERAFQSLSLKHHLETMHAEAEGSQMAFLPGAGATYMSGCDYALVENRWMAIFVGHIENYAYCVKKYCLEEAGLDAGSSYLLETVRALSPLNNAEVVALLFKKLGPTFMSKLRGSFSFVVYDSQVGYVLATNDCNGTHSLWQAHIASDNSLLVACNCEVSVKYIERAPIAAGEYKFGWRSVPVPYMASSETVMSKCSEARQAALDALASASVPVEKVAVPSASRNVPRVSTRRHTFTAQRSGRPSLSGIYNNIACNSSTTTWNAVTTPIAASPTRPGSYVPPHRRSLSSSQSATLPVPPGPTRPPPSMPRNMPTTRSVDRRASLSDRAQSWRRAESEELPRLMPQESFAGTPDTFVPMLAPAIEEADASSAPLPPTAAQLTHALSSIKSAAEKSQGDDEEDALRAAPYYQMATASMLFKPATIDRKAPEAEMAPDAEPEVGCSMSDDDDFVWPSHRSHPIPIRASRDSRPSFDVATKDDVPAPADVEPLAEKNNVNSSVESLVSSGSDESDTAVAEDNYGMQRPSSLMFPCSEAGSSAPANTPGLQGQLAAVSGDASNGLIEQRDASGPLLRVETFRPACTSRKASAARELLDKVAQTINPAVRPALVAGPGNDLADFPDIGELSFPSLKSQEVPAMTPTLAKHALKPRDLQLSVEEEPGKVKQSGEGAGASMDAPAGPDDVAPVRRQVKGGMKASGSFSDALQLLLQSRSAGAPAPKVKQAVPRPRSSLVHVSPAVAVTPDLSSEANGGAKPDEAVVSTVVEDPTALAAVVVPLATDALSSPPVPGLISSAVPRDLHALPTSLLASIAGGDDGDAQEKAALASLLYSSPCALCILDATSPGHPVAYVNSKFHADTGYSFEDAVGLPCKFLQSVPGGRRHASVASVALERALSRGRNYTGKILNFAKDGTPVWNQLSIVPIRNKANLEESTVRLIPQRSSSYMVLSSLASGDAGAFELMSN